MSIAPTFITQPRLRLLEHRQLLRNLLCCVAAALPAAVLPKIICWIQHNVRHFRQPPPPCIVHPLNSPLSGLNSIC